MRLRWGRGRIWISLRLPKYRGSRNTLHRKEDRTSRRCGAVAFAQDRANKPPGSRHSLACPASSFATPTGRRSFTSISRGSRTVARRRTSSPATRPGASPPAGRSDPLRKGETGEIDRWRTSRADGHCPQPASGAYAGPAGLTGAAPCKQNWWRRGGRLGPNSERSPDRHTMAAAPRFPFCRVIVAIACRDDLIRRHTVFNPMRESRVYRLV